MCNFTNTMSEIWYVRTEYWLTCRYCSWCNWLAIDVCAAAAAAACCCWCCWYKACCNCRVLPIPSEFGELEPEYPGIPGPFGIVSVLGAEGRKTLISSGCIPACCQIKSLIFYKSCLGQMICSKDLSVSFVMCKFECCNVIMILINKHVKLYRSICLISNLNISVQKLIKINNHFWEPIFSVSRKTFEQNWIINLFFN